VAQALEDGGILKPGEDGGYVLYDSKGNVLEAGV